MAFDTLQTCVLKMLHVLGLCCFFVSPDFVLVVAVPLSGPTIKSTHKDCVLKVSWTQSGTLSQKGETPQVTLAQNYWECQS